MAEYDKEDGRPGFLGPDLDALDEDLLSADLEADLDGDIGEEARDEGGLGDSGDAGLDGEFEDSDDERDDDEGGAFGGPGFSGGFGAGGFLGAGGSGGPDFSFGPSDSGDSGGELFDFESPPPPPSVDLGGGDDDSPGGGLDDAGVSFAPSFDDHSERGLGRGPDRGGSDDAEVEVHSDFIAKADRPSPSDFVSGDPTRIDGKKTDDEISGDDGGDVIRGFKGDDTLDGGSGDDWLRGGHGDDELTGGAGSDVVDGGKGVDSLKIKLDPEELTEEMWDELQDLRDWMAENANDKRSTGHAFNDAAARSAGHPIYVTSFGLTVRNIEALELEVEGFGPIDLDGDMPVFDEAPEPGPEPEPEPLPEPEGEPTADSVVVDIAAEGPREPGVSTVDSTTSGDGALSVEALSVTLRPGSQATISVDVEVREA